MPFASVLFDLDGTLTDPAVGITRSVQYALRAFGVEESDRARLVSFIGPPLEQSFRELYGFSPEQAKQAVACYRVYFRGTGIWENKLYPGVRDMLQTLQNAGKTLLVASSKPEIFVRQILEHFGLAPYFAFAGGSELDGRRVQKDEVIRYVLERSGANPRTAAMVGDRRHDVRGARKNGLASIGVLYGYGGRDELLAAGADKLADSVAQLTGLLL